MNYVHIVEEEGEEAIEIPTEEDGSLLLSTVTAQFPGCSGLKYKTDSNSVRGVRLSGGRLYAPPEEGGWESHTFICVFPKDNKRKGEYGLDNPSAKTKKMDRKKCTDLIVLGLAWKTDENTLREYFAKYGELVMVQLKRDPSTHQSKGFGFIRFADYDAQVMCIAERHFIDNRWCDVKVPISKAEADRQEVNKKVFIGPILEDMTVDTIRDHFSKFGEVTNVYVPKPFRAFAFVTFADADVAGGLIGQEHTIKDHTVKVGTAVPILPPVNNTRGIGAMMDANMGQQMRPSWGFPAAPANTYGNTRYMQPAPMKMMSNMTYPMPQVQQTRGQAGQGPADMNQNASAMAALNILNNPNVVAAIMSAANQGGPQQAGPANSMSPYQQYPQYHQGRSPNMK